LKIDEKIFPKGIDSIPAIHCRRDRCGGQRCDGAIAGAAKRGAGLYCGRFAKGGAADCRAADHEMESVPT